MFYKFNAHQKGKTHEGSQHALAKKIFQKLTSQQRNWAGYMQRQASKWPMNRLKALCLTIMVVSSAYSLYLITNGLFRLNGGSASEKQGELWPLESHHRLQQSSSEFDHYLDSLEKAVTMDSLNFLNRK